MPITNPNIRLASKKRLERRGKYGNVLFDVFASRKEIKNLENTKKKTQENLKKLEILQEHFKAKDNFDKEEYEKVNLKIERRKMALQEFENTIQNGITLYLSLPINLVLQANCVAMKKVSERKDKIEKENVIEEFNQVVLSCEMDEKIKSNILNTTYNITENLTDTLKEYKNIKSELEKNLKEKMEGAKAIDKIPSTWITMAVKGIQMALVSLGALEVSTIEQLDKIISNTSVGFRTFFITAAAIGTYEFIDKQGKKLLSFLYKIWFKHSTKRKLREAHDKYVEKKNEILNSLYDNISETIHMHLKSMVGTLYRRKIISEKDKLEYELMILKNKNNDRIIIENLSNTIEKQL